MTTNVVAPNTNELSASAGTERSMWRRYLRRPLGMIALVVFLLILLIAIFAPLISHQDPSYVDFAIARKPSSPGHLLGGDSVGRDEFTRLLYGARTTLYGAFVACLAGIVLGVPFGVAAGYFGKALDKVCTWISDALQSIPGMIALLIVAAGTGSNFTALMITLGVFISPGYYRIARSRTLTVRSAAYIDAARVAGLTDLRILASHVVKAVYAPIIIQTGLTAGLAMGIQAGLQFLGVGSADTPSWGAMMNDGFQNIRLDPALLLRPSIALGVAIAALAVIGSTLGDLVSVHTDAAPRRRKRGESLPQRSATSGTTIYDTAEAAISVQGLRVRYHGASGATEVLHGVTLDVAAGEVLGIVGESGSGKTQTVFSIMDLLPVSAETETDGLWIEGTDVSALPAGKRRALLGRSIGYVPQEPMTNLDPCYTIGRHLTEPLRHVHGLSAGQAHARAVEILTRVGIHDPKRVMASYPHQISGGMAQRVLIAGAVIGKPSIILADEPTTALDVTIQAEVLQLLRDLQEEYNLALVIVTHNFGVVADICDRVVVMKDGAVVETGLVDDIFAHPTDPYTRQLIAASLDDADDRATLDAAHAAGAAPAHAADGAPVASAASSSAEPTHQSEREVRA